MKGDHAAAAILIIVGISCMVYAAYRFFALDQSVIPLGPVGLMCTMLGVVQKRQSNG